MNQLLKDMKRNEAKDFGVACSNTDDSGDGSGTGISDARDFDTDSGDYTTAEAYCSGNYYDSKLHNTHAYVKGIVNTALPDDGIVVWWRFATDEGDTDWWPKFNESVDAPGEWLRLDVEPGTVAYIESYGQVGYGHLVGSTLYYTLDTNVVYASIPP